MPALSRADALTRRQPVDRQIVVAICKFAAGLAGARRLTAVRVGIPCGGSDLVELDGEPIERRVHKSFEKALAKFVLGQARTGHSLARRCIRHRRLRSLQSRPAFQGTRARRYFNGYRPDFVRICRRAEIPMRLRLDTLGSE